MIAEVSLVPRLTYIHAHDKRLVSQWAKSVLAQGFVLIDTETTGLEYDSEVIQIAALRSDETVLLDNIFIKPRAEIDEGSKAFQANRITNNMVARASNFEDVWAQALPLLENQHIIIYNKAFDTRLILQSLQRSRASVREFEQLTGAKVSCAMEAYAAFVGERRGDDYRFQKLPGGDHTALGDCIATLELLKRMAAYAQS